MAQNVLENNRKLNEKVTSETELVYFHDSLKILHKRIGEWFEMYLPFYA